MKSEDLFLAIGAVEETRLARSELCASSTMKQEEKNRNIGLIGNGLQATALLQRKHTPNRRSKE